MGDFKLHDDIINTCNLIDQKEEPSSENNDQEETIVVITKKDKNNLFDALMHKVSRERIGIEVEGMFSGNDARPIRAIGYMKELNLLPVIFTSSEIPIYNG